jgi:hypothetical protein
MMDASLGGPWSTPGGLANLLVSHSLGKPKCHGDSLSRGQTGNVGPNTGLPFLSGKLSFGIFHLRGTDSGRAAALHVLHPSSTHSGQRSTPPTLKPNQDPVQPSRIT